MKLRVQYPWKPPVCAHCKVFGHGYDRCSIRPKTDAEKSHNTEVRGQRKEADMGDGSSRGGFNGRGRGGFGGRDFGDQRFNRNDNSKYVPVKKNNNKVGKDGVESNQNNKGKNKQDTDMNDAGISGQNGASSSKKGVNENGKNKKKVSLKGVDNENMFFVLTNEVEIEKRVEWESMKSRIDEAREKGLHISKEERDGWTKDLYGYYKVKLQELVRKTNVKDLKLKIDNLDRQIVHSNKMVAIESRNKANSMYKSVMVEQETWSDEKIEFYKNSISEEAFEKTREQIRVENNEVMNKDVVDDLSDNALFMAKNVVTNVIDSDINQMQVVKDVGLLWDGTLTLCLLNCYPKVARLSLWKNLVEHRDVTGGCPWVMLGDFNIILRINENSRGINVRTEGIKEFIECIEDLKMEDINMNGIFANFMPYLSSDRYPAVLCLPDVALVKRLKAMKKHMRGLNRRNGNVFDKVKFLKTELERVQECLDKDPSCSLLREEEMLYTYAYKEAANDEEKLVSQSRIEVIYDRDRNACYGDKVAKQKLDVDRVVEMIKPISEKEIKDASFSIEDNKASGPDGYTSKFFKAAWTVVRHDVCATVNELFASGMLLGELNSTLISIIHKVSSPTKFTDYRPISCCNVVYKTISKLITNRLKVVLSDLVDVNQSAFIPESHGFFKAKRGLRQGDPISLYLFTLVMEVLNLMVKRQVRNDRRFKCHSSCKKLGITSLFFADDLLMLCHRDMVSASILRRGLDEFSMSSGLYPSMNKSNTFFCNIPADVKDEIKLVMPFREGVLPIRYLGVPLVSKRVTKKDCRTLMEVIHNKVNSLKNKCLSFAGRVQLIALVFSSMQVYWCSLFILPLFVCDDFDSVLSKFLWSNMNNSGGMVSIKWNDVCKAKNQGGLGLKSMNEWNNALMAKHILDILSNKNTIWVKWIKAQKLKVLDVPIPVLNDDLEDRTVWINKKGREKNFNVSDVWKAIRVDYPKVNNESHSHMFFSCNYSKGLWEKLKPMALLDNLSNEWAMVVSGLVNYNAKNSIWSVIQRLTFGAVIYFLWQERNIKRVELKERYVYVLFNVIVDFVRLKLMGLTLKCSPSVIHASKVWNFNVNRSCVTHDKLLYEGLYMGNLVS
ncbi:RNA-directed DNA polymerase, eukaryota, reverse transcriptase zinc-binding domain protein [Tanacetum coccineum]